MQPRLAARPAVPAHPRAHPARSTSAHDHNHGPGASPGAGHSAPYGSGAALAHAHAARDAPAVHGMQWNAQEGVWQWVDVRYDGCAYDASADPRVGGGPSAEALEAAVAFDAEGYPLALGGRYAVGAYAGAEKAPVAHAPATQMSAEYAVEPGYMHAGYDSAHDPRHAPAEVYRGAEYLATEYVDPAYVPYDVPDHAPLAKNGFVYDAIRAHASHQHHEHARYHLTEQHAPTIQDSFLDYAPADDGVLNYGYAEYESSEYSSSPGYPPPGGFAAQQDTAPLWYPQSAQYAHSGPYSPVDQYSPTDQYSSPERYSPVADYSSSGQYPSSSQSAQTQYEHQPPYSDGSAQAREHARGFQRGPNTQSPEQHRAAQREELLRYATRSPILAPPAPTPTCPPSAPQAHAACAPEGDLARVVVPSQPRRPPARKQILACLFCRERKIACGRPPPDAADPTCNQCARRRFSCTYPTASRRGQHKRGRRKARVEEVKAAEEEAKAAEAAAETEAAPM